MSRTVAVIIGTRPEAVKLAPVVLRLRQIPGLRSHVCVTGQHGPILDQVLAVFGIEPEADLARRIHAALAYHPSSNGEPS